MRTLGWEVLRFLGKLPSPSDPRRPFVLSEEQAAFVCEWYELDDRGKFLYRRGGLQEAKGWGKSPLGAGLAIAEFAGPVRFGGWAADGEPVGRPWGTGGDPPPWVQVAASSEEQADSNVYAIIFELLAQNDGQAARDLGVDLGRGRLYLPGQPGAKLEAVTSSWGAREGQRVVFGLLDESHYFLKSNGGQRLARVVRRNAAKMDGRTLELANAHELGEESVIEQTATAFEEGQAGVLFTAARPSRLPVPEMPDEELRELLAEVYSGASWVDLDRLVREVRDPDVPFEESLRFFFNLPAQGLLAAVSPTLWADRSRKRELRDGEKIALGFDGSHSQDGTALVACTADGWLAPVEIIERPAGVDDWRVDRNVIHRALEYLFATYDVAYLYADPWKWQDELEEWASRWPERVVAFATNTKRMPPAVDRFRSALAEGRVTHDGDHDLARHVLNARLRKVGRTDEGRGAYILEKPGAGRLIDAAVASVLAYEASRLIDQSPEPELIVMYG